MEQVDSTIIPIIQSLGCKLPGDVQSVAEFESDHIYIASSAILRVINPDAEFPPVLPKSKAARFRSCTAVANTIEGMGYTEELGYQNFLYPNVPDMRKLLMWLVDKLPKVDEAMEEEEIAGAGVTMSRKIDAAMKDWTGKAWSPFETRRDNLYKVSTVALQYPSTKDENLTKERKYYLEAFQPLISQQPAHSSSYAPSLFEFNAKEILLAHEKEKEWEGEGAEAAEKKAAALSSMVSSAFKANFRQKKADSAKSAAELAAEYMSAYGSGTEGSAATSSAFSRRTDFGQEGAATRVEVVKADGGVTNLTPEGETEEEKEAKKREEEDAIKAEREATLDAMREQLKKLKEKRIQMDQQMEDNNNATRQLEGEMGELKLTNDEMEKVYKVKKRTLDLLPNAEENLKKLRDIADASAKKLIELAAQWEEHRVPLVNRYRKKKQLITDRKSEVGIKVDQIKRMRQEMKEKAQDLRAKDEIYKQVLDELKKMPKSVNRQVYVRRIMDIVKNLDKQKVDIKNVLEDVRQVQKDTNMLADKSKRSFDVVDEVVFQAAKGKKDAAATQTYKYVVELRDGFAALVNKGEEVGKLKNEIRDITSSVEALEARNTNNNMKQVVEDLTQVKEENKKLASTIKKKRGKK